MSFNSGFLDQLRSRTRLSELIGGRVKLTRRGREYIGLCPFHHEKTPSFTVNDEKEFYHCFGCGAHGDAIRFLVETQNCSFKEAVEELAGRAGMEIPKHFSVQSMATSQYLNLYETLEKATAWFQDQLRNSKSAQDYLKQRGLSAETIKQFRIGYAPTQLHALSQYLISQGCNEATLLECGLLVKNDEEKRSYDRFRGRIIFPIKDAKGRVVAFGGRSLDGTTPKYLNSPDTPLFAKGRLLYGYDEVRQHKEHLILIVEGYVDVIALHQAGFKGALAPLGTALTEEQILLCWRLSSEPILCFDGDEAGMRAAVRALERVFPLLKPGYSLQFVFLPQGEDPDSLLQAGRNHLFNDLIKQPVTLIDMLWKVLTSDQVFKTPERKASLQQTIEEWLNLIRSPLVRKEYRYALKNLYFETFVKRETKVGSPHSNHIKILRNQKLSQNNFYLISYHILLAIVINHPNLLDEVVEKLAHVEIHEPTLSALRNQILEFMTAQSSHEVHTEQMKEYLVKYGFKEILQNILSSDTYMHAAFAKDTADIEEAKAGFNEVHNRLQQKLTLEQELEKAQASFQEDMSPLSWEKLKELRKVLQNVG